MTLLYIYLGTTVVSIATTLLYAKALDDKVKKDGYEEIKQEKTSSEKVVKAISTIFKLCIPVYNILNSICLLVMGDKALEQIEKSMLIKGYIVPKSSKVTIEKIDEKNEDVQKNNYNNIVSQKRYSQMTNEEKLMYLSDQRQELLDSERETIHTLGKRLRP